MEEKMTYKGMKIYNTYEVEIDNIILRYFVEWIDIEYASIPKTHFFRDTKIVTKKKFFTGKQYQVEEPVVLFTVPYDAFDKNLTKSWWKQTLTKQIELLGREAELHRGELI